MPDILFVNPDGLGKPLGQYSHLTRVKAAEFVFIAGQVGVDKEGRLAGESFEAQCTQTFANIEAARPRTAAALRTPGVVIRVIRGKTTIECGPARGAEWFKTRG